MKIHKKLIPSAELKSGLTALKVAVNDNDAGVTLLIRLQLMTGLTLSNDILYLAYLKQQSKPKAIA